MDHKNPDVGRLTYSVSEACQLTSIGKTRLYELISEGRLATRKLGRRTLVLASSLHELLELDR